MRYLARLSLSLAIVATVEWRSDEDAVTMSTLLLVSFALGWSWPQLCLLSGVMLGTTIPALNLLTLTTGVRPAYETALQASTHRLSYVAGLLLLIGPAVAATSLGGVLRGRGPPAPTAVSQVEDRS